MTTWVGAGAYRLSRTDRFETLADPLKFTAAVALLAILSDAAVGHALLWENDPYWTYWITKTFAELRLVAEDRNPRVTPLPPHDRVELRASVDHPDGTRYEIRAVQPLVEDPKSRFGTWWGVGFERWHHGRDGIGTPGSRPRSRRSPSSRWAPASVRAAAEERQ